MGKEELLFLKKMYYENRRFGPPPFDYIGIDEAERKYLIDVTSTKLGTIAHYLKERDVGKKAIKLGFKIVQPIVYFLDDWWVGVKLEEIR